MRRAWAWAARLAGAAWLWVAGPAEDEPEDPRRARRMNTPETYGGSPARWCRMCGERTGQPGGVCAKCMIMLGIPDDDGPPGRGVRGRER